MNSEGPEERIRRLLRELADEQERRLPPVDMGQFERNLLLRQLQPAQPEPRPGVSLWDFWRARFRLALAFATTAAVVVLANLVFLFNGPWQGAGARLQLALQWPATPPFDAATTRVWRFPQAVLPKGLPDFGYTTGTLGGTPEDRYVRWRLATVIVQAQGGFGSGAVISTNGWILTAYDVVAEATQKAALQGVPAQVQVRTARVAEGRLQPREPALTATLYRADPRRGLALLKLDAVPAESQPLPHFRLADGLQDGQECFVVGSQPDGPAWWIRGGNVGQQFDYPDGLGQAAPGGANDTVRAERLRSTIVVSDTEVSAGDTGGPLLNAQGELIGITIVPAANRRVASVGWHIALADLRGFVAELPSRPEGVPFDPWTAGLPGSVVLDPELADGDGDERVDSLRYRHVNASEEGLGGAGSQALALTVFVDLAQRTGRAEDPLARVPAGLWGMEKRGGFEFDLFLLARADGVTAVGYANERGLVDELRVGRSGESAASVVWSRDSTGRWQASEAHGATPLLDTSRVGKKDFGRLQSIAKEVLAPHAQRPVPDKDREQVR